MRNQTDNLCKTFLVADYSSPYQTLKRSDSEDVRHRLIRTLRMLLSLRNLFVFLCELTNPSFDLVLVLTTATKSLEPNLCDPKGTLQCDDYATCCKLADGQYGMLIQVEHLHICCFSTGCCPYIGGVCCNSRDACCPAGFKCSDDGCVRVSFLCIFFYQFHIPKLRQEMVRCKYHPGLNCDASL